ncbi:MAG: phenylalanine--tRNA ligase subunit beta, partial [Candidatus Zixiibacteriota bacterium]
MQLPYKWINELIDIPWPAKELAERLTLSGAEAETLEPFGETFRNIIVGQIVEIEPIEGTDHLQRAIVDTGSEKVQVVCGAPNAALNQKIVFAQIGAVLGENFTIKKAKLRGVESNGMICSERELGISENHSGILVLDDEAPLGVNAGEYLGLDDAVIELDLTPNRMDMLCAIGVARDIGCLSGQKIKRPEIKIVERDEPADKYIKISTEDIDACPRYAARLIKNVKIEPSPWWIKRKLILSGIRPISNVVDITNLVMLEFGHPLHAFDYDKIETKEIVVRRAKKDEIFSTLDGNEHKLTPNVLLITDGQKGIAAGGVMGGLESEVTDSTKNILLEAAYFNMAVTRKSRMELGINSESSHRFERGMDPNIIPVVLDRAASLMAEYAGGDVLKGIVDCYPQKIESNKIEFRPKRANAVLGTNFSKERMVEIFTGLEFLIEDLGDKLVVTIPTWQPEITREIDLIEEIVRIESFNAIQIRNSNNGPLYTPQFEDDKLRDNARTIMTALGYDEIYNSSLANSKLLSKLNENAPQLKILNPIADDLDVLQNDLNYSLLKAVSHNIAQRNVNLTLFEIGYNFQPGNPPQEIEQVGIAVSGNNPDCWYQKGEARSFYDLKGAIDALCLGCNIPEVLYREKENCSYSKNKAFELIIDNCVIGFAGEIRPEIAREFDIKQTVLTAYLDFKLLLKNRRSQKIYKPLPKFPAAPRDLAIVVDESIAVGEILSEIRKVGTKLLENVDIFD